jgi:hypothetical protein
MSMWVNTVAAIQAVTFGVAVHALKTEEAMELLAKRQDPIFR